MEANVNLAALAFAVGIVALLWVLRRTLLRQGKLPLDPDKLSYQLRKLVAQRQIDNISMRVHYEQYSRALKVQRTAQALPTDVHNSLRSIARMQQGLQRRHN